MALFFDSLTATGGSDDDFIFGTPAGGANNSFSGGLGDDLIIGDLAGLFTTAGGSAGTATDLTTDTSRWSTNENPDISDSTGVPHTTIYGSGNGAEHWYSFLTLGDETATIDLDYGDHDIGGSADFIIEIYDTTGNTLLASNDNADATDGGNGSTSDSDPFLEFQTGGASRFFIRVKTASGDTVPIGAEYVLNVSLTGQTATGTPTTGNDSLFGGDGDDVLYGQGGADFIEGGNDDDTIEGGSGGDNLNGGDGSDTASFASSTSGVTVRLDFGTALGGHAQGDTLSNFENVIGSAFGDFLSGLQNADSTLLGGGGNDQLSAFGGTNLLSGGDGNDSITVELVAGEDGSTLDGGDGNDTLIIVGFADSSEDFRDDTLISLETLAIQGIPFDYALTFRADQITQFSAISGFAGPDADRNITVEMGSTSVLDLSGIAVSGFEGPNDGFIINGDSSAENITGSSVNDTVNAGGGSDIVFAQGGGDDDIRLGESNDGVFFGANFDQNDKVDGGAGDSDQLALQGDYSGGITFGQESAVGIELVVLLPGSLTVFGAPGNELYSYDLELVDANIGANEVLAFQANTLGAGEDLTVDASAETDGAIFTFAGLGAETITGSVNDDAFFVGTGRFGADDRYDGNAGAFDSIGFQGDFSTQLVIGADQLNDIDVIAFLSSTDSRFGAGGGTLLNYNVKTDDGNVEAGATMIVSGNALLEGETIIFDGSAETDGQYSIFFGNGEDQIQGSQGNDLISGAGSADTITGHDGDDTFFYSDVSDSSVGAEDTITDFEDGDLISISAIDANTGVAGNDAFAFVGSAVFSNTAGELRAVNTSGNNWRIEADNNGDGAADLAINVTTSDGSMLDGTDFIL